MNSENLKCPKCGYIFEADTNEHKGVCPLCSVEYETSEALKLFEKNSINVSKDKTKTKSTNKIILEWIAFFGSFAAFIVVIYMIVNYILGA